MRGRVISPSHNPSKTKFRNYSLRNRSITSTDKDFDKLFEDLKKSVINEIVKEAEIKFNEHKEKFINFINNYKINEDTQTSEIDNEEKNISKITRTKKKSEKNIWSTEQIDESEQSNKFPHLQNKNKRNAKSPMPKLNKKNNKKDSLSLTPEINKKDLDDEIPESIATDSKLSKKAKKKSIEKKGNENDFVGKKRKKLNENFLLVFKSEPNYYFNEDQKKSNKAKKGKTIYKRKTK